MQRYTYIYFLFGLLILFGACRPSKYLKEGELLYNGATLKVSKPLKDQPNKNYRADLSTKVRQKPNSKFKLWVYMRNKNKTKGLGKWMKEKVGEPPVLYEPRQTERSRLLMETYLRNNGFLHAEVSADTVMIKNKVEVRYFIKGNGQYTINEYFLPPDTTLLLSLIKENSKRPIIRPGRPYTLTTIDAERLRIENLGRNNGFYEFNPDAIYFYVDTIVPPDQSVDVHLVIRPPANEKKYRPHKLGAVTIYPDYILGEENTQKSVDKDTIRQDQWTLIQNKTIVELAALQEAIAQDSGAVYDLSLERQAINYLLDFGIFKFVNLRYDKDSIDGELVLQRSFYLTPSLNQDFGINVEASTERTNFLGSSIGVNYTHRNAFNTAVQFNTGLSAGAELQVGKDEPLFNTLQAEYNAGLVFPRLLLPFKISHRVKGSIPKTLVNLNATYQRRNTLFTSFSGLAELGYSWKINRKIQHQIFPFQFTLLNLLNTSMEFQAELDRNPRLRASFDDLFILAANYRFSYTNQLLNTRKDYTFFRAELETAGNIASLFSSSSDTGPSTLLNVPVAQFSKVSSEIRYTWFQRKTSIVGRFSAGLAVPYGNSKAVPYIRQFFVGGASSNRGYRFRGVGPGTYSPPENTDNVNLNFFDRTGDIKIEGNLEYRFPLAGYFNGALFADAGNVWLSSQSGETIPEGLFDINTFYKELAVSAGIGLRIDVQYVVIRFDLGIPVRDPSRSEGDRWLFNEIDLVDKDWRSDNLTLNIAIGYPF
jgi:outer membrane protein assembly factor BamA